MLSPLDADQPGTAKHKSRESFPAAIPTTVCACRAHPVPRHLLHLFGEASPLAGARAITHSGVLIKSVPAARVQVYVADVAPGLDNLPTPPAPFESEMSTRASCLVDIPLCGWKDPFGGAI